MEAKIRVLRIMAFNLISERWIPVRRKSGRNDCIRPADLTTNFSDDPIVALNFPRPDWNGAVTEWLIGLTFLALRPENDDKWADRFRDPPLPEALSAAFSPFIFAFDLDGPTVRAFQDFEHLAGSNTKPISGLLMDAPGEETLKNNGDLFNKRGGADALGLPFAAAALITLQTYAPAGGRGNRTSMRGGGPLTTLVAPRRRNAAGEDVQTLWDRVWSNTPPADFDPAAPGSLTPPGSSEWAKVFPWLASTKVSANDHSVTPEDATQAQVFFACPRRIRLVITKTDGICALSGEVGDVASGLLTRNYGANYMGWTHPLSPYRQDRESGFLLPLHPHAGATNYGDFSAWLGLEDEPALVLRLWAERRKTVRNLIGPDGVEAFGFDMADMKARQWLEARLPWAPVYGATGQNLRVLLRGIIAASDEAARALRFAVKVAIYGQRKEEGGYKLPDTLPKDALPEPAEQLWQRTEVYFHDMVFRLVSALDDGGGPGTLQLKEEWLVLLRREALRLFRKAVDLDGLTDSNPHRLLSAQEELSKGMSAYGAAAKALQLSPPPLPPAQKRSQSDGEK